MADTYEIIEPHEIPVVATTVEDTDVYAFQREISPGVFQTQQISGANQKAEFESKFSVIQAASSDETTDLSVGAAKLTFRMPHAMNVTEVRASLNIAAAGSDFVVDINKNGSTVLSTKLSIDAGEKTSLTATTPAVISDPSFGNDAEITIDIDQIGVTTAGTGLKVLLIGTRL